VGIDFAHAYLQTKSSVKLFCINFPKSHMVNLMLVVLVITKEILSFGHVGEKRKIEVRLLN